MRQNLGCLPNGPRISCGDSSTYPLTFVSFETEPPVGCMRLLCRSRPIRYEPGESSHDPLGGDGLQTNSPERLEEVGLIEAVGLGMGEQAPNERMDQGAPQHLLGVEAAARPQNPCHLGEGAAPLGYVVNDAKVEHGVVGRIRRGDARSVAGPEPDASAAGPEPGLRLGHHPGIKVKRIDPLGTEEVEDDLSTNAAATADLQRDFAAHAPSESQEATRLNLPLQECANGGVAAADARSVRFCKLIEWIAANQIENDPIE